MYVQARGHWYEIKFGFRGLKLLTENSKKLAKENQDFLAYCALITMQPNITIEEAQEIAKITDIKFPSELPSLAYIEELEAKALGEIGLTYSDFLMSTPEEIELIYKGYLRRKELEANLNKLAYATQSSEELIRITEDEGHSVGSIAERK